MDGFRKNHKSELNHKNNWIYCLAPPTPTLPTGLVMRQNWRLGIYFSEQKKVLVKLIESSFIKFVIEKKLSYVRVFLCVGLKKIKLTEGR